MLRRFFFECKDALTEGIRIFADDLRMKLSDREGEDITVTVRSLEGQKLPVESDGKINGAMVDMYRNAVMTVGAVKTMLGGMALMGLGMFMLYTEDTYEIKEYPYFGYMRGRYTEEELRENVGNMGYSLPRTTRF